MHRPAVVIGVVGLGLLLGLGMGVFLGYSIWPVRYINVEPKDLHPDWQAEYVRMVALAYARDRDLALAQARLALLGDPIEVLQRLIARSPAPFSPQARSAAVDLLHALRASSASRSSGGSP
ncbi:MAG: hypothetical protein RMK32_07405 [Anaerolineae bacterium]|nr:hypothetical protein [Thermoflexus sp.]MDW8065440.1 hypothetical protein [Anaerolineae bacterium]